MVLVGHTTRASVSPAARTQRTSRTVRSKELVTASANCRLRVNTHISAHRPGSAAILPCAGRVSSSGFSAGRLSTHRSHQLPSRASLRLCPRGVRPGPSSSAPPRTAPSSQISTEGSSIRLRRHSCRTPRSRWIPGPGMLQNGKKATACSCQRCQVCDSDRFPLSMHHRGV